MTPFPYQQRAIDELLTQFKRLWVQPAHNLELTFKAPTGSGKTFMVESFINQLSAQPDWSQDVCFVWITFSDDLAMQSRDKFSDYFFPNIRHRLLTVQDFSEGILKEGDILFLNWQKLVSQRAENRLLRRPSDERDLREQGYYFEDIVEATHATGRKVVMVIDESHKNDTDAAMRDVIGPLNPKIILKVSATPEREPSYSDVQNGRAGFVEVKREDVVAEGVIKAEMVCQTQEDLQRHKGEDLDALLLKLAMERRKELADALQQVGIPVNPLVLIQLPDDKQRDLDEGVKTKETIVTEYLLSHGVAPERIAYWFDKRKENMEGITDNDSPVEYMLFKVAASTGWDCPRAHVLVMFREIVNPTFHTQVLGRIIRVPWRGETGKNIFSRGYLYTNYQRNEVKMPEQNESNKPKVFVAESRYKEDRELDPKLLSDFIPRADYGDLGNTVAFQQTLHRTFCSFFNLNESMREADWQKRLEKRGLMLNPQLTREIIVNARFDNVDMLNLDFNGNDTAYRISRNDVEKLFTSACAQVLREQTDEETKVGNIARSFSVLKRALRLWMLTYIDKDADTCYRIFLNDLRKEGNSAFRRAITETILAYRPLLNEQIKKRREQARNREATPFILRYTMAYTEDYEALSMKRCLYSPFYIRKEYDGRKTELPFATFLDAQEDIDWWMKNGDSGRENFAITYVSTERGGEESLFYPDWIVRFKDGTIGIFDTKGGQTASSQETKDKAEALWKRISILNGFNRSHIRYVGGIVIHENALWYVNASRNYTFARGALGKDWEPWDSYTTRIGQ